MYEASVFAISSSVDRIATNSSVSEPAVSCTTVLLPHPDLAQTTATTAAVQKVPDEQCRSANASEMLQTITNVRGGSPRSAVPAAKQWEIDTFLRSKADRLCRTRPFVLADRDDLFQELRVAWLANNHRFDANRGNLWAFLKTIVDRTGANLRAKALAQRRYSPNVVRLDHQQDSRDPISRIDPHRDCRRSNAPQALTDFVEQLELRQAVSTAIHQLPHPLADLCHRVMSQTPTEISRDLDIPRTTVASRITAIRKRFENMNLEKYL